MARSIPFTLAGEKSPRHLRLDMNAVSLIEERVAAGIGSLFETGRIGVSTIRACLWAGLLHESPELTIEETGDLMDAHLEAGGKLKDIGEVIGQAVKAAGLGKAAETSAPPPAAAGEAASQPSPSAG